MGLKMDLRSLRLNRRKHTETANCVYMMSGRGWGLGGRSFARRAISVTFKMEGMYSYNHDPG